MFLTMTVGIAAVVLGDFLGKVVPGLRHICIPPPVTGGIVISLLFLLLHAAFGIEFKFDVTLKDLCMVAFFTSVGFQSNLTVLKKGGRPLLLMVILVALLIVFQNLLGVGTARVMGINPLIGLASGSVTMCGGHGTGAGFSPLLAEMGLAGADSIAMSAATFGLIAGSLMGAPLADHLVRRKKLAPDVEVARTDPDTKDTARFSTGGSFMAICELFIAMGLGSLLNKALALTGISFPTYFGALLTAVLIRNLSEAIPGAPKLRVDEISSIGSICLTLFLGIAMVSLQLWELKGLALPMLVILCLQVLMMFVFARFLAFPLLGKDYDAALLVSGICGFGLGATPNAMANISAVCAKHRYSPVPYLIVPIVGAVFVDLINISAITLFINLI